MAAATESLVGQTIGSFRITKVIGRGGMGTVYLGEHTVIASRVAIKVLMERLATDENLVARFYAEARAVNLIGHENIVNIFDMNVVPPHRYYLVMEYLEGKPLNYLMTAPIPTTTGIPILLQVCDALQAAHDAGIVPRDLKPENIFIMRRGKQENFVKVLDFGLAKLLDTERADQHTAAGLIVGTPEFMSPEQANSQPVDGRADIYGLGCIAWLMATARLPFPQRGLTDLLVAHRMQMPKPPHEVVPSVPVPLSDVIMKSMAKDPADRFQSAAEFGKALEDVLEWVAKTSTTVAVAKPPPAKTDLPPPPPAFTTSPAKGPAQPRFAAKFTADVETVEGRSLGTLTCTDISRGGMFLAAESPLPALFSKVKITLTEGGGMLLGEVVRHVTAEQAKAWGMSGGFGVQFVDLTPVLRDTVTRLIQGLPVSQMPKATVSASDDPETEKVLEHFRQRINGDHYVLIGVSTDAESSEVRTRAREAIHQLERAGQATISSNQRSQLEAAIQRVKAAADVLGNPMHRAEFDANRGNFRGVMRCLQAGLTVVDLERLRTSHLAANPNASGGAYVKLLAANVYETKGQLREAVDAVEAALHLDPLNLTCHQRRLQLLKKLRDGVPA
ncbi:MAG: serine/threonine-protein kinase [Myxococcales bacterium]|nr:serine/threonine-protein kinase [Myxococcales bacterium]